MTAIARRLSRNPLIQPRDVPPSMPALEVVSVFNAAAAKVGDEILLLLRVAERPRSDIELPRDAMTLDLDGPEPVLGPLARGYGMEDVVGMAYLDASQDPPAVVVAYIPRDLPGLDLSDPRSIRYRNATSLRMVNGHTDYLAQISHLRLARSRDGERFEIDDRPAVAPLTPLEEYGVEDPRATLIDGEWHVTYVSVSRLGITTSRATTRDFRTFERKGVMFLPDHKDVVLFPERVGGRYVALTRPMPQSFARIFGIWIAFSDDLVSWGEHMPLALPRWDRWDELRTGASAVPFRTGEGWLELYHGVDRNTRYAMGAILLDGDDPRKVLARSPAPILAPEEPFERMGLFNDTVFSCGHVALDDDTIRLYYGAADSVVAAADLSVREIVASLEPVRGPDRLLVDA
ncbi:MAG TPA: glycoside hydrolase family 130 protein [Candidatus Limnocylindria bacterium]|nr:glycoside hydrolase family 130 protein [Candidatus Limnocylindria bacterium]